MDDCDAAPRLSVEVPRCWWVVMKPSGARLFVMQLGASEVIQVSVKTKISRAPSHRLSWISAALFTAERAFSRPSFKGIGA